MDYETVIGLEVHSQLNTDSKMFCSCMATYQEMEPNTIICPVCIGMPGTLPVPNTAAIRHVIRTGLALGCEISSESKFDRKNYPYPDLMKGYQISQMDKPIALNGYLLVEGASGVTKVRVNRVHLEEDVAKLMHKSTNDESYSLLDINRSGVPLMEIVSEPDLRSADQARDYLTSLRSILRYLDVSTANMEEGSFRCDANISIRPFGDTELGPKVEVKNMNSFRAVHKALMFEQKRQINCKKNGERIVQETRGWADQDGTTFSQRSKENAHDYRYFPEPDIPPFHINESEVVELQKSLPELPQARRNRFKESYGLSGKEAEQLTLSKDMSDYFEQVLLQASGDNDILNAIAKVISNWLLGEMTRLLNERGQEISMVKITPVNLIELQSMVDSKILSSTMAKEVFERMFDTGMRPTEIVAKSGMQQISDESTLQKLVEEAIQINEKAVEDFLNGKDTATRFLVGQVMKLARGKANPQLAEQLVVKELGKIKME
ncbi:MAG: aspartyl-tRNA(Asn)/glutamyl-tRNA(Gln) amidotransferase subunit B [Chloroflexi bacterium]|nr:MAG: aspartyl-tRNA(Asn)/glutamyl-tRNA(Gln) amidotransferase subunit B [Chloroflexota bacterium]